MVRRAALLLPLLCATPAAAQRLPARIDSLVQSYAARGSFRTTARWSEILRPRRTVVASVCRRTDSRAYSCKLISSRERQRRRGVDGGRRPTSAESAVGSRP